MGKQKINMVGGGFQHDVCSSAGSTPKLIEWVKGQHTAPISIHIDSAVVTTPTNKNKLNYGWLSESKTIQPKVYEWCVNNIPYIEDNFELLFTHDKSLTELSDKIKLVICSAKPWVQDCGIFEKTKLVSMIASSKVMCEEHRYRQQIIKKFRGKLDHYGRGYNPINKKEDGLKDYCFSIAMENHTYALAYSEKITDCFATGTIPIYWGCDLNEVFDNEGIIYLDDDFKIEDLSTDLYMSKLESVKNNFEIVVNMPTTEDYIYENYIK